MWLVVGLGNPGPQYENTRHNIGFMVADRLVARAGAHPQSSSGFHGELFKTPRALFLKPTTYMNRSGISVAAVKNFYKIATDRIIVVHDDLDLPFGAVRFKKGGGSGGHNGLKSLDSHIGNDYLRVRMGIGRPLYKSQVADYVLQPFGDDEKAYLPEWIEQAADAVEALFEYPLEAVSSRFSRKRIPQERR